MEAAPPVPFSRATSSGISVIFTAARHTPTAELTTSEHDPGVIEPGHEQCDDDGDEHGHRRDEAAAPGGGGAPEHLDTQHEEMAAAM